MSTTAIAPAIGVRFHVGLFVSDLHRSVAFYRVLLGGKPVAVSDSFARFESERPAFALTLYPGSRQPGGALNHVGLRLADSASLVAIQRRLEEAGIATQSQEGVECCYARATKFWVADPDRTLWELYTLEADVDHSGFDDLPVNGPGDGFSGATARVVYKGPFARVTADDGTVYVRGEKQTVTEAQWEVLRHGAAAAAFVLLG
jgi:catechol 2,3-dioxygenase-like lactoylglutathione lyase family enzyme